MSVSVNVSYLGLPLISFIRLGILNLIHAFLRTAVGIEYSSDDWIFNMCLISSRNVNAVTRQPVKPTMRPLQWLPPCWGA